MASKPFTLALLGRTIFVGYEDTILNEAGCELLGQWNPATGVILLKRGMSPELEHDTLIHECVEAINDTFELGIKHHAITTLGAALEQMLRPLLRPVGK